MLTEKQKKTSLKAILRAIAIVGSQAELSRELGLSRLAISKWARGITHPSLESAMKIQMLTKGVITGYELRPDFNILNEK